MLEFKGGEKVLNLLKGENSNWNSKFEFVREHWSREQ